MSAQARRVAFKPNWAARAGWLLLGAYCVYASQTLDITWERFSSASTTGSNSSGA
jgi:phosphonate transport system permease protein